MKYTIRIDTETKEQTIKPCVVTQPEVLEILMALGNMIKDIAKIIRDTDKKDETAAFNDYCEKNGLKK